MTGAEFGGVDIDLLADYIGGALTGTPEESAVAARISDDQDWQAAYASLTDGMAFVSAELGRFEPEPMPADLAARLDAALTTRSAELTTHFDSAQPAASTNLTATTQPTMSTEPTAEPTASTELAATAPSELTAAGQPTASTELASAGRPSALAGLGAAAPATFLDLIAAGVDPESAAASTAHGLGSTATNAPTENAVAGAGASRELGAIANPKPSTGEPARRPVPHLALVRDGETEGDGPDLVREKAPAPPRGRRLRRAAPIAVAAGVIAFVGFGLDYLAGRSGPTKSDTSASSGAGVEKRAGTPLNGQALIATGRVLASGTDYTRATLKVAPDETMTTPYASSGGSAPAPKAPAVAPDTESALQRLTLPAALNDCLNAIEQANAAGPLAVESVDYARFAGAPAVIVRFAASNGHWAWASGPDCGTPPGDAATLDQVPVG